MPVIFDIKRFALHDGPGIRTTVFFKGCPLRCPWCHNPESHDTHIEAYNETMIIDGKEIIMAKIYGKRVDLNELVEEMLLDRVFYEESGGGATISGGEPLMQFDALLELLQELGNKGIHRAVDTSGYAPAEKILEIAAHTDLFLYDLKIINPNKHKELTGADNELIINNADLLLEGGHNVVFRIPVIPGINDSEADTGEFLNFFQKRSDRILELHLLPYHKTGSNKYKKLDVEYEMHSVNAPDEKKMNEIKTRLEACGCNVKIGG
ncbi:MAG: glycyl-radical enzyme activating protein [Bacteroidales bacterium]|nr:glycyl-radical enzyme activating protein [Bacteroidales bacterium]